MIRHVTLAFIALALALAMTAPSSLTSPIHAAAPHDQNIGYWEYTCRVDQINTYETITVGADVSGPLGNVSGFAARLCTAFVNVASNAYNNGYESFPLNQPRPGEIQCSYIYRYGGYWQLLQPPYSDIRGATLITVRDTADDTLPGSSTTYGVADCGSIGSQLDQINAQNGYNTTDQPLALSQTCVGCSGGGGGTGNAGGFAGTLPKPPKAKRPAQKPLKCIVNAAHGNKKTCHR